jgi:adenosine deaminase
LNENFIQTFAATGLTAKHAWQLAANSFEGSFVDAATKAGWMDRLNESFAQYGRA